MSINTPCVYVVIATYNAVKWIDKSLTSLRDSVLPVNIIIIDNGSTDGTQELVLLNYPEVELLQSQENLGFGKANNIGIKKAYYAGADYFFLLNQDAWIEHDTLLLLVNSQKAMPEFGIVSPIHLNGAGTGLDRNFSNCISPARCEGLYSDIFCKRLKIIPYEVTSVNAAAWLMSRVCIATVGGFSPAFFHYGEDDNYQHRLHYHGLKVGICAQALVYHDREQRPKSYFFTDKSLSEQRRIRLQLCNPNGGEVKGYLKKSYIKHVFKSLALLRYGAFKDAVKKYLFLKQEHEIVDPYLTRSKYKGLTFLE